MTATLGVRAQAFIPLFCVASDGPEPDEIQPRRLGVACRGGPRARRTPGACGRLELVLRRRDFGQAASASSSSSRAARRRAPRRRRATCPGTDVTASPRVADLPRGCDGVDHALWDLELVADLLICDPLDGAPGAAWAPHVDAMLNSLVDFHAARDRVGVVVPQRRPAARAGVLRRPVPDFT